MLIIYVVFHIQKHSISLITPAVTALCYCCKSSSLSNGTALQEDAHVRHHKYMFQMAKTFFDWGNLKEGAPVCLCVFLRWAWAIRTSPCSYLLLQTGSFPARLPWESSWGQQYPPAGFSLGQVRGCRMKYVQQMTAFHFEFSEVAAAAVVDVVFFLYLFTGAYRTWLQLSYATCYYDI